MPTGCRFHPRCPYAIPECASAPVELTTRAGDAHIARRVCIRSVDELSLKGAQSTTALLEGTGVVKHFPIRRGMLRRTVGHVRAVDGVDLAVDDRHHRGTRRRVGLGQVDARPGAAAAARSHRRHRSRFDGTDITRLPERKIRELRRGMQLVFQDPYSSFDPLATIADSMAEPMRTYLDLDAKASDGTRRRAAAHRAPRVPSTATATRASSPVVSCSASPSPGRSRSPPSSWCSTSR